MRDMTIDEIEVVSGGIAPLVAIEVAVLGYTAANIGYNFLCGFWEAI